MKRIFYLILIVSALTSCSDDYDAKSEIVVSLEVSQDSTIISKTDSTSFNKDVVYSEDGQTIYIIEKSGESPRIIQKISSEGESVEVVDWFWTILLFILLLLVFSS